MANAEPELSKEFADVDINGESWASDEEEVPAPGTIVIEGQLRSTITPTEDAQRCISTSNLEDLHMENGDYYVEVTVADPEKVGEGMSSYLTYKISTRTNYPKFKRHEFSCTRRFSDFLGLHSTLVNKYCRLGKIIPPAPSKNLFGNTKLKMGGQQNENGPNSASEWVGVRRAALERFLNRTANQPTLRSDVDFINFLESEEELPRAVNTATLSGAGVMRLFNKFGETVNKLTYRMDENDTWFDEKVTEIETLDSNFQRLHSALKSLVSARRDLSMLTGHVGKSAALLSSSEEDTGLSRALSSLADVKEKVEILRSEQANSDLFILSEFIKDYLGLFHAIKCIFHERVKAFQNWQHAQLQLSKRRENRSRFEVANRTDKLDQAQQEVEEWQSKVQRCQQQFEEISTEIKKEMNRFEIVRVSEFKSHVIKYIEDQMAHQQQIITFWESFAPFARDIA